MKVTVALKTPPPPPPPDIETVTITMTLREAELLKLLSAHDTTIPKALYAYGTVTKVELQKEVGRFLLDIAFALGGKGICYPS